MYPFRRFVQPYGLKPLLVASKDIALDLRNDYAKSHAYSELRSQIEKDFFKNPNEWRQGLKEAGDPKVLMYFTLIPNLAMRLKTNRYHIFGQPTTEGNELIELHYYCLTQLLGLKKIKKKEMIEVIEDIRESIAQLEPHVSETSIDPYPIPYT